MMSPTPLGPSVLGARAAKELMLRIEGCNRQAVAKTGQLDLLKIAELLEDAMKDPRSSRGVRLALAEFIGTAIEGSVIDIHKWTPLEQISTSARGMAKRPIKRF